MPEKQSFKLNVISDLPLAVVFGADFAGAPSLIQRLTGEGLSVLAVAADPAAVKDISSDSIYICGYENWPEVLEQKDPDYVVDFEGSQGIKLAEKYNIRILRVVQPNEDIGQYEKELKAKRLDWRLAQIGHIYGPLKNLNNPSQLQKLFLSAVFNKLPKGMEDDKQIYPIYTQDASQGLYLALLSPIVSDKTFIIASEPILIGAFWKRLAKEAQVTQKDFYPDNIDLSGYLDYEKITETQKELEWRPKIGYEEGISNTVQYLFQKLDKGEIKPPPEKPKKASKRKSRQTLEDILDSQEEPAVLSAKPVEPAKPVSRKEEPRDKGKKTSKVKIEKQKSQADEDESQVIIEEDIDQEITFSPPVSKKPEVKHEVKIDYEEKTQLPEVKLDLTKETKAKGFLDRLKLDTFLRSKDRQAEIKNDKTWKHWWLPIPAFIILFFVPLFYVFANLYNGASNLTKSLSLIEDQSYSQASVYAKKSQAAASRGKNAISYLKYPVFFLGRQDDFLAWLNTIEKTSWLASTASSWSEISQDLSAYLMGGSQENEAALQELKTKSERLMSEFSLAQTSFGESYRSLPYFLQVRTQKYKKLFDDYQQSLNDIYPSLELLSFIMSQKKMQILVLLQNSAELRPGGGFIGSYAVLTLEEGRMIDYEVNDVYTADGQLEGHVDPPEIIARNIDVDGWYLRDSNWSPDFQLNARNASWFFEKETGIAVDGVVGVTLEAAKNLLAAIGEVHLPGFNETVNADNFFAKAESYSEKNFFPGSTQKKDFLGELFGQMLINLQQGNYQKTQLAMSILKSFRGKEALLWFESEYLNTLAIQQNWGGAIRQFNPAASDTIADYLYISEANVGVNKANYFLNRAIEKKIYFENDVSYHELSIKYENFSKSHEWPSGDYKNYLRVLIPEEYKVKKIFTIGSDSVEKEIDLENVDFEQISNKQSVGFMVNVPIDSRLTVKLEYSQSVSIGNHIRWVSYWQKQPGFGSTPITLYLSFPDGFAPAQVEPAATVTADGVVFNKSFNEDSLFALELMKSI